MAFEEMFESDPQDAGALISQLGGEPPMSPEDIEKLARLKALIASTKPVTIRDEITQASQARPAGGPTVERAKARELTGDTASRRQAAIANRGGEAPPAGNAFQAPAAALSGAVSSLADSYGGVEGPTNPLEALKATPKAVKDAAIEAGRRYDTAPVQAEPPTVSGELGQRTNLGGLSRFALDATIGDPTNAFGGEADDLAKGAVKTAGAAALSLPALLAKLKGKGKITDELIADVTKAAQHLNPPEQAALRTPEGMQNFLKFYNAIPDVDTLAGGVQGGAAKRGWYQNSRRAIEHVHGEDADVFAGVLAATSPQNSVETNFINANNIFDAWKAAGRPDKAKDIEALMRDTIRRTTKINPKTGEGEGKTLTAWINNTVRVLQDSKTLSGAKVDSFWTNLRSRVRDTPYGKVQPEQATTLDAWMANVFGAIKDAFSSSSSAAKLKRGDPGYSPNYLGGTARMREVAAKMGIDPAEAQETLWTFGKALSEQADATPGMTARQIVEQGLLDPKRILETPDFAVLYRNMGHDMPEMPKLPPIMSTPDAKEAMLKLADNLDALKNRRTMATQMKTAGTSGGTMQADTVMAMVPMESRTGGAAAQASGDPFKGKTPKAQDQLSAKLLTPFEDIAGRNRLFEAGFPGETTDVIKGTGDWVDEATGKRQNNLLQTTGVRVPTIEGGTKIAPDAEALLQSLTDQQSIALMQDAGAYSALQFGEGFGQPNAMRAWPPSAEPNFPKKDFLRLGPQMEKKIPGVGFATPHRTEGGIDAIKLGGTLSDQEQSTLDALLRRAVGGSAKGAKDAGIRAGVNIAGPDAYRPNAWAKALGQRNLTEHVAGPKSNWAAIAPETQARIDQEWRSIAPDLLRQYSRLKKQRPDHLNYLRILGKDGMSGLAKALGDPSQLLPVLAAIGVGSTLAIGGGEPEGQGPG